LNKEHYASYIEECTVLTMPLNAVYSDSALDFKMDLVFNTQSTGLFSKSIVFLIQTR